MKPSESDQYLGFRILFGSGCSASDCAKRSACSTSVSAQISAISAADLASRILRTWSADNLASTLSPSERINQGLVSCRRVTHRVPWLLLFPCLQNFSRSHVLRGLQNLSLRDFTDQTTFLLVSNTRKLAQARQLCLPHQSDQEHSRPSASAPNFCCLQATSHQDRSKTPAWRSPKTVGMPSMPPPGYVREAHRAKFPALPNSPPRLQIWRDSLKS